MTVSYTVALCTHNNADRLKRTLGDFTKMRPPEAPWEFLIIDNVCRDGTPDLLTRYVWPVSWQVRVVREEKLGLSNARNRAIVESQGEYVIFIDDDETVDADWLCAYERLIVAKRPDAFGGRICVKFDDLRPTWLSDELLGFLGELNRMDKIAPLVDPDTSFHGGNFGIRKAICVSIGKFDTTLGRKGNYNIGGEDVDFYRRLLNAGMKLWWTPEAIIYHRIQAIKLKRSYFLNLHYHQGYMEAIRARGMSSRFPPKYFYGQLFRALAAVWHVYRQDGRKATCRKEMNVAYFLGRISGWAFGGSVDKFAQSE